MIMPQHDQLHRYLFGFAVRGELVTVSEATQRILVSYLPAAGENRTGRTAGRHWPADRDAEVCRRHYGTALGATGH